LNTDMPTKRRSLPELAVELVRLKVDVFVVGGLPGVSAAQGATTTIPVVMTTLGDPVTTGLVASLARPGGNITGLSSLVTGLNTKRPDWTCLKTQSQARPSWTSLVQGRQAIAEELNYNSKSSGLRL
jgi:hypothetical protein